MNRFEQLSFVGEDIYEIFCKMDRLIPETTLVLKMETSSTRDKLIAYVLVDHWPPGVKNPIPKGLKPKETPPGHSGWKECDTDDPIDREAYYAYRNRGDTFWYEVTGEAIANLEEKTDPPGFSPQVAAAFKCYPI